MVNRSKHPPNVWHVRFGRLRSRQAPIGALPRYAPTRIYGTGAAPRVSPNAITISRFITQTRDYADVARYDATDLPLEALIVINYDTTIVFGWLASRGFWLWQQFVKWNHPRATTARAYNSFPAPELSRTDRERLETAAHTVLTSRAHFLDGTLADLYSNTPPQLQWAHNELDALTDELLGIANCDDQSAIAVLANVYEALAF